jgi:hypothetical protein
MLIVSLHAAHLREPLQTGILPTGNSAPLTIDQPVGNVQTDRFNVSVGVRIELEIAH